MTNYDEAMEKAQRLVEYLLRVTGTEVLHRPHGRITHKEFAREIATIFAEPSVRAPGGHTSHTKGDWAMEAWQEILAASVHPKSCEHREPGYGLCDKCVAATIASNALNPYDVCSSCAGTGKPVSGLPCICGGDGTALSEAKGLRVTLFAHQRHGDEVKLQVAKAVRDACAQQTVSESARLCISKLDLKAIVEKIK